MERCHSCFQICFKESGWWKIMLYLLWRESGKPPAQVDPIVRVIEKLVFVPVVYVALNSISSSDNYAQVRPCPLVDHVNDVVFFVVKDDQR